MSEIETNVDISLNDISENQIDEPRRSKKLERKNLLLKIY